MASGGRPLRIAESQAEDGFHNWCCFSCEQAAQLGLKALLHGLGRGPYGHDLLVLFAMLTKAGLEVPEGVRDAAFRLGRHYIAGRYPDAHASGSPGEHYGPSDSRTSLADAESVLELVDRYWEQTDEANP